MRILVISSVGLTSSASLAEDYLTAVETGGNDVTFLSKYPCKTHRKNVLSLYDSLPDIKKMHRGFASRVRNLLKKILPFVVKYREHKRPKQRIVNITESHSPVPVEDILSRISGMQFDIIITIFMEGMMNMATISSLSESTNTPILINSVDMALMTGGCYYPLDCREYLNGCKLCPAKSEFFCSAQPNINFLFKKKIFEGKNCFIAVNDWLFKQYSESSIIDKSKLYIHNIVINNNIFKPVDISTVRAKFNLPNDAFIMFAGASYLSEERKGFKELCRSLELFDKRREKNKDVILILASREKFDVKNQLKVKFQIVNMPFLPLKDLADIYACSDLFLSPSLNDAGPSMVNQSLMSGTPVVSFDTGVAQTVIINGKTGFKCDLADCDSFAKSINFFYSMSPPDYQKIREQCRMIALRINSIESVSKEINGICRDILTQRRQ